MFRKFALPLTLLSGFLLSACGGDEQSSSANAITLSLTGRVWVSESQNAAAGGCRLAAAFGENQRFAMAYSCESGTSSYYEFLSGTYAASGAVLALRFDDNQCSQGTSYFWTAQSRANGGMDLTYRMGSGQLVFGSEGSSLALSGDQRRADSLPTQAHPACYNGAGAISASNDAVARSVKGLLLAQIQALASAPELE